MTYRKKPPPFILGFINYASDSHENAIKLTTVKTHIKSCQKHLYQLLKANCLPNFWHEFSDVLTSELQSSELEGDQTIADLYKMHQSVQIVRGQNEAVPGTKVAPAAQQKVTT